MPIQRRRKDSLADLPRADILTMMFCGGRHHRRQDRDGVTEDELRAAWMEHEEAVLQLFVFGTDATVYKAAYPFGLNLMAWWHSSRRRRPWAWWLWSAPEPRRKVGDGMLPAPNDQCVMSEEPDFRAIRPYTPSLPRDWYESETAYLDRLGLWLPGEQALK